MALPSGQSGWFRQYVPVQSGVRRPFAKLRDWSAPDPASHVYAKFLEELITITTSSVSSSVCSGATMLVPYTVSGMVDTSNVFTAELSNASGSFTSPVAIGTKVSSNSGQDTIVAVIPSGTAPGNAYRVRVVASSPSVTGSVTPTVMQIKRADQQLFLEQMGSVERPPIATHEAANGFDNDAFTMTGTATFETPRPPPVIPAHRVARMSLSPTAVEGISRSKESTPPLLRYADQFCIFRNGILFNNDAPVVEVSANGSTYTTLSYASIPSVSVPAPAFPHGERKHSVHDQPSRIRFRQAEAVPTNQYRIDDVRLTFSTPAPAISAILPRTICNGSSLYPIRCTGCSL